MSAPRILDKPTLYLTITTHGGTVLRISERSHSYNGYEWIGLIVSASGSSPSIDPNTFESYAGSYSVTLNNSRPCFAEDRFSDLAASVSFANEEALLQWKYEGGSLQTIYYGVVSSLSDIRYETCTIQLTDFSARLEKKAPWPIALENDYPGIDPDDVGKVINTIWGTVKRAPCLAIDAGGKTTLAEELPESQITGTFEISDGSKFPSGGSFTVQIENEQILVTRSGNVLTIMTRGYNGTDDYTTTHDKGQAIAEIQTEYVYLLADHPVTTISNVYVDGIRQIENITTYNGSSSQHSSYPGKAIIVFDVLPSFAKQINLAIDDQIRFTDKDDASRVSDLYQQGNPQLMFYMTQHNHKPGADDIPEGKILASLHTCSATCTDDNQNCMINNNLNPHWTFTGQAATEAGIGSGDLLSSTFVSTTGISQVVSAPDGTPSWVRLIIDYTVVVPWTISCDVMLHCNNAPTGWHFGSINCSTEGTFSVTRPYTDLGWRGAGTYQWHEILNSYVSFLGIGPSDGYILVRKVEMQVLYAPSDSSSSPALGTLPDGSLYRVGTVSVTGNSSADVVIGKKVSADCTGYNVSRPDQVRASMLTNKYGVSYDSTSFNEVGSLFSALGYTLGVCISESLSFKDIQDLFIRQCRTALYWIGDKEYMKLLK